MSLSDKKVLGENEVEIPILLSELETRPDALEQSLESNVKAEDTGVQDPGLDEGESVGNMSNTRTALLGIGIMFTWFLGAGTSTSVTLIVPSMAKDLGVSELEVQWVASAYSLAYGCGMLFMGRIADLYGRKLLYLLGLSIFVVFTILSGVVRERNALYVLRAFAGLGLAIAGPAGYGIIGTNVRREPARTICFAALGIGAPAGSACGTLIGGAIAGINTRGWQYLFFVLGGFAVFPLVLGFFVVPRDTRSLRGAGIDRRVDWIGGGLGTLAFSLLLFSLAQSGIASRGWNEPYIPALLGISVVLLLVFYLWERYLEERTTFPPILKPSMLSNHQYKPVGLIICVFSIALAVHGFIYNTTIFYQNVKGMTPLENAIHFLPSTICGLLVCVAIVPLVPRVRAPILMAGGSVLTGLACALYAIVPEKALYWRYEFPALLLIPWGIDLIVGVGNICMSNLVEQKSQSVAGALSQTAYQIGVAFGFSISSLISTLQTKKTGSLLTGLHDSMWSAAAFCWIVPLVVFVFFRHVRLAKDVAVQENKLN